MPKRTTFYQAWGVEETRAFDIMAEFLVRIVGECLCTEEECENPIPHFSAKKVFKVILGMADMTVAERCMIVSYYENMDIKQKAYWIHEIERMTDMCGVEATKQHIVGEFDDAKKTLDSIKQSKFN